MFWEGNHWVPSVRLCMDMKLIFNVLRQKAEYPGPIQYIILIQYIIFRITQKICFWSSSVYDVDDQPQELAAGERGEGGAGSGVRAAEGVQPHRGDVIVGGFQQAVIDWRQVVYLVQLQDGAATTEWEVIADPLIIFILPIRFLHLTSSVVILAFLLETLLFFKSSGRLFQCWDLGYTWLLAICTWISG